MEHANHPALSPRTADRYIGYALPLAKSFSRVCRTPENDPKLITERLIETFEVTLRFATHVGLAEYLSSNERSKNIDAQLGALARPALGMYSSLLRELAKHGGRTSCVSLQQLQAFYHGPISDEAFDALLKLSGIIEYPITNSLRNKNFKQLLDVVVNYRNKRIGHAVSGSKDNYRQIVPLLATLVQEVLEGVRPLAAAPLIRPVGPADDTEAADWMETWNGYHPGRSRDALPDGLESGRLYARLTTQNDAPLFVDLFPFFYVDGYGHHEEDPGNIFCLNGIKKSKLEFLSFVNGATMSLAASNPAFDKVMQAATSTLAIEAASDGYNPLLEMEISPEAEHLFRLANVDMRDGNDETSIMHLKRAVSDSPVFREAALLLTQLQLNNGAPLEANETVKDYLALFPNDFDFLVLDAKSLLEARKTSEAQDRIDQLKEIDPENHEVEGLESRRDEILHGDESKAGEDSESILLPHHALFQAITGRRGSPYRLLVPLIVLLTAAMGGAFAYADDYLMAITMAAFGLLWLAVLWTTQRVWHLLKSSEPNFCAFLRSRKSVPPAKLFHDLILPVFGRFDLPEGTRGVPALLRHSCKHNRKRCAFVFTASLAIAFLFYKLTSYSATGLALDAAYSAYIFLFAVDIVYLASCIFLFQSMLKNLQRQNIHFNMVQHPKLSIRYLSHLNRKMMFPLIGLYFLLTFMFYLGPFVSNISFVLVVSVITLLMCFSYYRTIFLVRSIIINNKWRLISQFSTHFHGPFSNLVTEAKPKDMARIKELMEVRDYIDSIDVWAERKSVLIGMSLFFLASLLVTTVGLSNVMTRQLVPSIARKVAHSVCEVRDVSLPIAPGGATTLDVELDTVDDSFLVLWGASPDDLRRMAGADLTTDCDTPGCGLRRCNWASASHGAMSLNIPIDKETYVLLVGFNNEYKGICAMGGGKYSHALTVEVDGTSVLSSRQFVRINTKEVPFAAFIRLQRNGDNLLVHKDVGPPLSNGEMLEIVSAIETRLKQEKTVEFTLNTEPGAS